MMGEILFFFTSSQLFKVEPNISNSFLLPVKHITYLTTCENILDIINNNSSNNNNNNNLSLSYIIITYYNIIT